jgi:serine/threonine protein kinase
MVVWFNLFCNYASIHLFIRPHVHSTCGLYTRPGPSRALVYEYCPGGSLYDRLANKVEIGCYLRGYTIHSSQVLVNTTCKCIKKDGTKLPPLTWRHRLRLAAESARAVKYLHCAKTPVVHRDIKSANILIGPHGEAKVNATTTPLLQLNPCYILMVLLSSLWFV